MAPKSARSASMDCGGIRADDTVSLYTATHKHHQRNCLEILSFSTELYRYLEPLFELKVNEERRSRHNH